MPSITAPAAKEAIFKSILGHISITVKMEDALLSLLVIKKVNNILKFMNIVLVMNS